jgi:dipeptidyl aminopeptidase/acylaminoacyl peptidase
VFATADRRLAAPAIAPDGRMALCVESDGREDRLVTIDLESAELAPLVEGDDFYAWPRWHPGGGWIAYVAWNHPRMPWDGTELRLARLERDHRGRPRVGASVTVAGGSGEAIAQPEFAPDGRELAFVSDRGGWSNLFGYDLASGRARALSAAQAEHMVPPWVQGLRWYGYGRDGRSLHALRLANARARLVTYRRDRSAPTDHSELAPYGWLEQIAVCPASGKIACVASSSAVPPRILIVDPDGSVQCVRRSLEVEPAAGLLSEAEPVHWRSAEGAEVHGLLYPPTGRRNAAERPPLLVRVHGGPTAQATARFQPEVQYFAVRGYAVLEVNYRGSSGYGRAYREALRGRWGQLDVDDAISGAEALAAAGRVDRSLRAIMGGSSGGLTALLALARRPGFFRAAVCLYPVVDLPALAQVTWKFEQRYLEGLIGPWPEAAELYRQRSPLAQVDQIVDPVAVFQGADDAAVPRAQADALIASLSGRGVPHLYQVFDGEGHGFRRIETIQRYLELAEEFLRRWL